MKIKSYVTVLTTPLLVCTSTVVGSSLQKAQGAGVSTHYAGAVSTTVQNSGKTNPEAAENQPLMATGRDLKGPPQRFPAGQTPE
jgi:hypothetical protein